ncbi:unnamed protein product [Arctia plantaginis]|uniref:Spaetzle domain-containing protein n=1 Tax=Arctia plantaginis TaxID=874455 RepID=A0A8S0Z0Z3_ARCPL|nr:unnamed protein product [Arctia plantaginis]CAB3239188.1 unnamed protein product [Arctia plantaginis]
MSTSIAFPTKDSEIIIPDECKGQRLCGTKPEGYEHLEKKINGSLPDLPAKDHDDKEVGTGVQKQRRSIDVGKQNCFDEVKQDLLYNYMAKDSVDSMDSNFELIATCPELRRFIQIVKCGQLQSPLSNDSNEQCFQNLLIQAFDLKSSCETIIARRTLNFYNEDKTKMYSRVFHIPVACSCETRAGQMRPEVVARLRPENI